MKLREDFQNLLPESAQENFVVVPKRSLQLAFASISILALGIGLAMGTLLFGSILGGLAMGVCLIASLVLGKIINKHETTALSHLENRDEVSRVD